jgi:hypothetical protein
MNNNIIIAMTIIKKVYINTNEDLFGSKFYAVIVGVSICFASNIDRDSGVDINLDFLMPKCLINAIFFASANNSLLNPPKVTS